MDCLAEPVGRIHATRWLAMTEIVAPSLRGAQRRSNPFFLLRGEMDCFAALAMTERHGLPRGARRAHSCDPLARNDGDCCTVIARSAATKQSILSFARRDGLLRCARNDGEAWITSLSPSGACMRLVGSQ